jgi:hypothetical protein
MLLMVPAKVSRTELQDVPASDKHLSCALISSTTSACSSTSQLWVAEYLWLRTRPRARPSSGVENGVTFLDTSAHIIMTQSRWRCCPCLTSWPRKGPVGCSPVGRGSHGAWLSLLKRVCEPVQSSVCRHHSPIEAEAVVDVGDVCREVLEDRVCDFAGSSLGRGPTVRRVFCPQYDRAPLYVPAVDPSSVM